MNLALFDLDHTLIPLDSDYRWTQFFIERCPADEQAALHAMNDKLMADYHAGRLDPNESLAFLIGLLARKPREVLDAWHGEYMQAVILPAIKPQARALVEQHRAAGDRLALVTATNSFVTAPIAQAFGFEVLIATEPELASERGFTGRWVGTPSFKEGKITRVQQWLAQEGLALEHFARSHFYSDSINDVPLLERVTDPVATNPSPALEAVARERGWTIVRLFDDQEIH